MDDSKIRSGECSHKSPFTVIDLNCRKPQIKRSIKPTTSLVDYSVCSGVNLKDSDSMRTKAKTMPVDQSNNFALVSSSSKWSVEKDKKSKTGNEKAFNQNKTSDTEYAIPPKVNSPLGSYNISFSKVYNRNEIEQALDQINYNKQQFNRKKESTKLNTTTNECGNNDTVPKKTEYASLVLDSKISDISCQAVENAMFTKQTKNPSNSSLDCETRYLAYSESNDTSSSQSYSFGSSETDILKIHNEHRLGIIGREEVKIYKRSKKADTTESKPCQVHEIIFSGERNLLLEDLSLPSSSTDDSERENVRSRCSFTSDSAAKKNMKVHSSNVFAQFHVPTKDTLNKKLVLNEVFPFQDQLNEKDKKEQKCNQLHNRNTSRSEVKIICNEMATNPHIEESEKDNVILLLEAESTLQNQATFDDDVNDESQRRVQSTQKNKKQQNLTEQKSVKKNDNNRKMCKTSKVRYRQSPVKGKRKLVGKLSSRKQWKNGFKILKKDPTRYQAFCEIDSLSETDQFDDFLQTSSGKSTLGAIKIQPEEDNVFTHLK